MYEGPIRAVDAAESEESPILRQLRWSDLVARIAATRECRQAIKQEEHASFAAFHKNGQDSQHAVNRDALSAGKMTRISRFDSAQDATNGDRETK